MNTMASPSFVNMSGSVPAMSDPTTPVAARRSIGAQRNPASAEAILSGAESLLVEEGYAGFSIEKVARHAKAGKPTIYKWWPSKSALLLDVYLRQKTIDMPDTGRLDEDISQFLNAVLSHWRDTPAGQIFRSVVAEAQMDDAAGQALATFAAERATGTTFLIVRGLQRREVREGVSPMAAARWIGAYLWYRLLTGGLKVNLETIREDVGILVGGLQKR
ncbi:TetR/AcrR family transcriptional regulator [Boseongicola sp. H5]|uniref:TetR/AcrR family transcriptional regulator n=1 Tax=Boseongicola sp. H5 TaxID=2763261 RepID=UPI001D0A112D|nr:TetR/AcrR family transcriptional regulator [Boseongicola sp. H5]